jgi:hypothetical protein
VELGREFVRTETRPTAAAAVRVPASLQELLGARLARLRTDVGDVLLEIAALARPTVQLVTAAHGSERCALDALDAAVIEGVVEIDDARVGFTHPLLGSICYQRAPLRKRRAVHRALAAAVTDVEERARHLALAVEGADAAVACELDVAAEHATARGATGREPSCSNSPPVSTRPPPSRLADGGCRQPGCTGWPAIPTGLLRSCSS